MGGGSGKYNPLMTQDSFDRLLRGFLGRQPFRPFTVEMVSGSRIEVNHPEALTQEGNIFVCSSSRGLKSYFECHGVARFIDTTGVA